MLALAVARVCPPATANPVLTELLNVIPGHAALALAACGGKAELQQLEARLATAKGWVRKEIVRAIKAIRKRL
jgi:hypothetical protein